MLNERSQAQKGTCCVIPFLWISRTGETQLWWGKSDQWWPGVGAGGSSLECWQCFFFILMRVVAAQKHTFVEARQTLHLKWLHFISRHLCLTLLKGNSRKKIWWLTRVAEGAQEEARRTGGVPLLDATECLWPLSFLPQAGSSVGAYPGPAQNPSLEWYRKCLLWHEEGWLCSLYIPA